MKRMRWLAVLLIPLSAQYTHVNELTPENVVGLNFLAVGDWGGGEDGSTDGQRKDAFGMGQVAGALNATFVLGLGDNFYPKGLQGNVNSDRFQSTFENVYKAPSLDVPWYFIAGNHDHLGNVTAEIEYTKHSKRWKYYAPWYTVKQPYVDAHGQRKMFQLIYIDTVVLAGNSDLDADGNVRAHEDTFGALPGPGRVHPGELADLQKHSDQLKWLEEELENSTADHLWVGGHYPVWSVCQHGPTEELIRQVDPMLKKHGAHYVSGHDHCLEYLEHGSTQYILSGAGDNCCYDADNTAKVPKGSLKYLGNPDMASSGTTGFVSFRIDGSNILTVFYHDQNGKVLYTTPPIHARQ